MQVVDSPTTRVPLSAKRTSAGIAITPSRILFGAKCRAPCDSCYRSIRSVCQRCWAEDGTTLPSTLPRSEGRREPHHASLCSQSCHLSSSRGTGCQQTMWVGNSSRKRAVVPSPGSVQTGYGRQKVVTRFLVLTARQRRPAVCAGMSLAGPQRAFRRVLRLGPAHLDSVVSPPTRAGPA
jgi:hypothetical protein